MQVTITTKNDTIDELDANLERQQRMEQQRLENEQTMSTLRATNEDLTYEIHEQSQIMQDMETEAEAKSQRIRELDSATIFLRMFRASLAQVDRLRS